MSKILVIDDEITNQTILQDLFIDAGYEVHLAGDGIEGLALLNDEIIDVVFLDIMMPKKGGIEVLEEIKNHWPDIEVVMMSGQTNIDTAVKAIKLGAYDYLEKPLDVSRILTIARNALRFEYLKRENAALRSRQNFQQESFIGETESIRRIREIAEQSASSDSRIMILGENGSGKELVARYIHLRSQRCNKPFIEVNCAAIPDNLIESELFGHEKGAFTGAVSNRRGKFELADRGTLFMDEVADMSLEAQAKVLRVVQEMSFQRVGGEGLIHVDVRIISATNKDIMEEIQSGRFREDLYYRLNVIPLHVPPLRERLEDIPKFIEYFCRTIQGPRKNMDPIQFSDQAFEVLMEYSWPGNIRELKNFIERITILVDEPEITEETVRYYLGDLRLRSPSVVAEGEYDTMKLIEAKDLFESRLIAARLEENSYNIAKTAQTLGVYPSNLHGKIKKHGIAIKK